MEKQFEDLYNEFNAKLKAAARNDVLNEKTDEFNRISKDIRDNINKIKDIITLESYISKEGTLVFPNMFLAAFDKMLSVEVQKITKLHKSFEECYKSIADLDSTTGRNLKQEYINLSNEIVFAFDGYLDITR